MKKSSYCIAVLFALALGFSGVSYAKESVDGIQTLKQTSKAFTSVAKKAIPAVVFIYVEKTIEGGRQSYHFNNPRGQFDDELLRRFFGDQGSRQMPREHLERGQGTGFIVTKDGYILTNNHVVGDADKIMVKLHDGREIEAKRIGSDPKSEVAVIKIDAKDLPTVALGSSRKLEIGEWVIAIGNPFGLSETLTVGVVSAKGRSGFGIAEYEDFIQTDAAINQGNSGGPLLNIDGEVIGINTAIYSRSGGSVGIGFAIPIDMAKLIKDQLVKTGKVVRGQIGILMGHVDETVAEHLGLESANGILINQVMEDSAGEKAGLKHGDVIVMLDGKDVPSMSAFRNIIASQPPGTKFDLGIVRDGKRQKISVTTGAAPGSEEVAAAPSNKLFDALGMTIENLTEESAERLGYEMNEGVVVSQVEVGGQAAEKGIQLGVLITNVGKRSVSTVKEFTAAVEATKRKGRILARMRTDRYYHYITLKVE